MSYQRELDVARTLGNEAGAILLRHYRDGTEQWEKSKDNPVTLADLESDRHIRAGLAAAFPDDAILSEETVDDASRLACSRVWIVDPMDGTKEFTQGIPEYAVSIALVENGEPVVGVVENPAARTVVWGQRGGGAFRDGERVHVSSATSLEEVVVIASRSEIRRGEFDRFEGWFKEIRPVGSIAWKLACVASGEGDFNLSVAPKNEWDVCAGDLLVREAGGAYLDFERATRRYNQEKTLIDAGMVAGSDALIDAFLARQRATAATE